MPMDILIKKGYLLDPKTGREGSFDILIEKGLVRKIAKNISLRKARLIEAKDYLVLPGLIDLHCHLREPGREDEETILSGSISAAAGGFTTVCCMPNTEPPLDNKVAIRFVQERAKEAACRVLPIGCITQRREGSALAPYGEMVAEGAVAFSDDGNCVMDSLVMRRALEYTKLFEKPIISHAEDAKLAGNGVMNEGVLAVKLGLTGIPRQAESIMVARDVFLSELTGGRLHIAHVTTAEAVQIIRQAKKKNKNLSCEVTVNHLILTEEEVAGYNTNAKVSPPLRTKQDVEALIQGLKDGTIDCIVTDHAPHSEEEKETGFEQAPFGMIGFETSLPLAWSLAGKGIKPRDLLAKLTSNTCRILGIEGGQVAEGKPADLLVFNPDEEWVYRKEDIKSRSKNSPYIGRKLKGRVVCTICQGRIAYQAK